MDYKYRDSSVVPREAAVAKSIESFVDRFKIQVERFGQSLKEPDAHWPILLCLIQPNADAIIVGISPACLKDMVGWQTLMDITAQQVRDENAVALAFLSNDSSNDSSPINGSHEVVIIQEVHADGLNVHVANVNRFADKPPCLGPWQRVADREDKFASQFITTVQPILRANQVRSRPGNVGCRGSSRLK